MGNLVVFDFVVFLLVACPWLDQRAVTAQLSDNPADFVNWIPQNSSNPLDPFAWNSSHVPCTDEIATFAGGTAQTSFYALLPDNATLAVKAIYFDSENVFLYFGDNSFLEFSDDTTPEPDAACHNPVTTTVPTSSKPSTAKITTPTFTTTTTTTTPKATTTTTTTTTKATTTTITTTTKPTTKTTTTKKSTTTKTNSAAQVISAKLIMEPSPPGSFNAASFLASSSASNDFISALTTTLNEQLGSSVFSDSDFTIKNVQDGSVEVTWQVVSTNSDLYCAVKDLDTALFRTTFLQSSFFSSGKSFTMKDYTATCPTPSCSCAGDASASSSSSSSVPMIAGAIGGVIVLILVIVLVVYLVRRNRDKNNQVLADLTHHRNSVAKDPRLAFHNPSYTIDPAALNVHETIGTSIYGPIHKGTYQGRVVAIKYLRESSSLSLQECFSRETAAMKKLAFKNHANLIPFFGVQMTEQPNCLVFEYVDSGNLTLYLRDSRAAGPSPQTVSGASLLSYCAQIARGMAFIASHNVVHGSLRGDHVLINMNGDLKINAIGRPFSFLHKAKAKLGRRWTAPEVLRDPTSESSTVQSDVWSFGVTLWEIATLGALPYFDLKVSSEQVLVAHLDTGARLPSPPHTPPRLVDLINSCFEAKPSQRPTMKDLATRLERLLSTGGETEFTAARSYFPFKEGWDSAMYEAVRGDNDGVYAPPQPTSSWGSNYDTSSLPSKRSTLTRPSEWSDNYATGPSKDSTWSNHYETGNNRRPTATEPVYYTVRDKPGNEYEIPMAVDPHYQQPPARDRSRGTVYERPGHVHTVEPNYEEPSSFGFNLSDYEMQDVES